jgi:hypothetical protein
MIQPASFVDIANLNVGKILQSSAGLMLAGGLCKGPWQAFTVSALGGFCVLSNSRHPARCASRSLLPKGRPEPFDVVLLLTRCCRHDVVPLDVSGHSRHCLQLTGQSRYGPGA